MLTGGARAAVDQTRAYLEFYLSDCAFGLAHVEVLRRHKVLLISGYFGDLDPNYSAVQGIRHKA